MVTVIFYILHLNTSCFRCESVFTHFSFRTPRSKGKQKNPDPERRGRKASLRSKVSRAQKSISWFVTSFCTCVGGKSQVCQSEITRGANKGLRMRERKTLAEFEQDLRSMVHFPDNVIINYEINKASAVDTAWICQYANNKKTKNSNPFTDLGPHFFGLTCGGCRLSWSFSSFRISQRSLCAAAADDDDDKAFFPYTCATERRRMGFMFFAHHPKVGSVRLESGR